MGRAWLLALCVGISAACVVELDHRVACGDGFHDPEVEECDPGDKDSWANACSGVDDADAQPSCNPLTCTLACSFCGDGTVDDDPMEDSGDLREECDPLDVDHAVPRPCAGDDEHRPLRSPRQELKPYTSGMTTGCLADCTYDRSNCGFCGDGIADGENAENAISDLQIVQHSLPEQCDGEDFDPDAMVEEFPECVSPDGYGVANVACTEGCNFDKPGAPRCCLATGADCPADDDIARCCHEIAEPEAGEHCELPFLPPGQQPPAYGEGGWKCK